MTQIEPAEVPTARQDAVFVTGSTMRHVIAMTSAAAVGLISIFVVDVLNLYYISLLGRQEFTAAIGYASTIMFFTISFSIGFSIATTAVVSRSIGSGQFGEARWKAGATLIYMGLVNVIAAIILFPLLGPILSVLGAVGETHKIALEFMQIVAPSIPLMGLGMGASGILRARGDARRAMYVTLSAGIVAAILDPILIFYLELGVQGAAISTAFTRVALVTVGFYGVWYVHNMVKLPTYAQLIALLRPYLFIAVPAVLTQIATPFSNGYMTATFAEFGDGAVAGWALIGRLVPLAFVAIFTLSGAVGPILGQNMGAQRYDRINSTMWNSLLFTLVYTLVIWIILIVAADYIGAMFGLTGEAASLVRFFCYIIGGTYIFQGGLFVANAAFNNLGYPYYSTVFNWGRATLGTIPFAWYGANWGANGVLAGFGLGGIFFGVVAVLVCFHIIKGLPQREASQSA